MGAMDLGSMESSSRISWRDSELAHSVSMATRGGGGEGTEGAEGSEAGGELGKAAWSTWRRHRRPSTRRRSSTATQRLREASVPLLRRAAQEEGRWVYDRWGPRVRFSFNF